MRVLAPGALSTTGGFAQDAVQLFPVEESPVEYDRVYPSHIANIPQGAGIEQNQVRQFAGLDGSERILFIQPD